MDASLHGAILSILDENRILSLATLRADGWPQATTVGYVSEGLTIYFMCGRESQKARNLALDDRVSLTIDHDVSNPQAIRGLSMAARAARVTNEATIHRVLFELLPKKYPEYVNSMQELDLREVAVFSLQPVVVSVLDYSKGFGHADLLNVDELA